jgi:hypothetical protein
MRIAILVEGGTERAFAPHLRKFLEAHLSGKMPKLFFDCYDGRIPTGPKLRRRIELILIDRKNPADAVIALTDVYTGTNPPIFSDAADAKRKMKEWVGNESRFHPHTAQHEFEAWLLPYWTTIQRLAKNEKKTISAKPETVNHNHPPSHHLKDLFRTGKSGSGYSKVRDAERILRENELSVSINACPELKSFINTIITLCGGAPLQ